MRRTEVIAGTIILAFGLVLLLGAIFNIDMWSLICPAGLIALGVYLIYRTRQDPTEGAVQIKFVGDIRKRGVWEPRSQEIWGFVLDSMLDFCEAQLPQGETEIRTLCFVNDFKAVVPADVGVAVQSLAFFTESRINEHKEETIITPFTWESENFGTAQKKVILKPTCFVSEIKIEQIQDSEQYPG